MASIVPGFTLTPVATVILQDSEESGKQGLHLRYPTTDVTQYRITRRGEIDGDTLRVHTTITTAEGYTASGMTSIPKGHWQKQSS